MTRRAAAIPLRRVGERLRVTPSTASGAKSLPASSSAGAALKKSHKKNDEPAHHGRLRIAAEITSSATQFTCEPDDRHASADAVRINSIFRRKQWDPSRTVNQHRQPLLRIIDHSQVVDDALKLLIEEHVKTMIVD
jgi:hypothetical protein